MKLVDISAEIDINSWEPEKIRRKFINHKEGADKLGRSYLYFKVKKIWKIFFSKKYKITYKDFPDKHGLSQMIYTLSTHTGTHVDAPFHYGKKNNGDIPKTITDLPLEYFYNDAVLVDFSNDNLLINKENLITKLKEINYSITKYRGIEISAIKYLISLGVRVIGTDAFSFDPPFIKMIDDYKKYKDKSLLWPAHFYGREEPYIQIERLSNLDKINRNYNFKVSCFPIKLKGADAAWCRAVALIE